MVTRRQQRRRGVGVVVRLGRPRTRRTLSLLLINTCSANRKLIATLADCPSPTRQRTNSPIAPRRLTRGASPLWRPLKLCSRCLAFWPAACLSSYGLHANLDGPTMSKGVVRGEGGKWVGEGTQMGLEFKLASE